MQKIDLGSCLDDADTCGADLFEEILGSSPGVASRRPQIPWNLSPRPQRLQQQIESPALGLDRHGQVWRVFLVTRGPRVGQLTDR